MVKNPLYKFKETRYNKENIGQEGCPMARMGFIQDKPVSYTHLLSGSAAPAEARAMWQ